MANRKNQKKSGNKNGGGTSRGAQKRAAMRAQREGATTSGGPIAPPVLIAGAVLLAVAAASAGMLVFAHLYGATIPGCGEGSGCDNAAKSVWGKIPGINWPTSFVGFAYFLAMLIAWIAVRKQGVPDAMRWIARLGLLASLFLVGVILLDKSLSCNYCLASHAANLLWVVLIEVGTRSAAPAVSRRAVGSFGGSFLAASGLLLVANVVVAQQVEKEAEKQLGDSITKLAENTNDGTPDEGNAFEQGVLETGPEGFRGKYLLGPEEAVVRFVVYSDYQCPDCKNVEEEIFELLKEYPDKVSISHKHFPMNADCNPNISRSLHSNACWAARAAETAGILGGSDGFWRMHYKLFELEGEFTQENFPAIVAEMGFDYTEFISIMQSNRTLGTIEEESNEAVALGLHFTPLVFVNGTEIKGFTARGAMRRAAEAVLSSGAEPATHVVDRPPLALTKYITDWKQGGKRIFQQDKPQHSRGATEPVVDIMVFATYSSQVTNRFEDALEQAMRTRPWVRYIFRHHPFDQSCNPKPESTLYEHDCQAARAAEAAAMLAGEDGFWLFHEWILSNQDGIGSDGFWESAAIYLNLDVNDFKAAMASTEVELALQNDLIAGRLGVIRGIPAVYIDDRWVPRWMLNGQSVIGELLDAAYEVNTGNKP